MAKEKEFLWQFISGMFVLFTVNFKAVRHFCGTRRKYAVFFSYFSFDSSLTHLRAQRIVWGHGVFLIHCLIPLLTAMFNLACTKTRNNETNNLVPKVSHLTALWASEERLWHTLVTCCFDNWNHQGGVLCNPAICRVERCRIQSITLCWDWHCPRCLTVLSLWDEISNIQIDVKT